VILSKAPVESAEVEEEEVTKFESVIMSSDSTPSRMRLIARDEGIDFRYLQPTPSSQYEKLHAWTDSPANWIEWKGN